MIRVEADLSPLVTAWFKAMRFEVWSEIAFFYRLLDLIAYDGTTLIAIELKRRFTRKGICQIQIANLGFDQAYLAVGNLPQRRSGELCRKAGIGLMAVSETGIDVLIHPHNEKGSMPRYREKVLAGLERTPPGGIGGLPCLKGQGPAQKVERLIESYRAEHSSATWRELFEKIPSHYASYRSMQGAMRMLRERRHWTEQRQKNVAGRQAQ